MLDGKIPKNKVYLDVCTLCRPFDDQRLMRIRLETDSYYLIIKAVQNGELRMIVSPAHLVEVRAMRTVKLNDGRIFPIIEVS